MIQLGVAAIIAAIAALVVRQIKPEFAIFVQLGGILAVALLTFSSLQQLIGGVQEILQYAPLGNDNLLGGNNAFTMLVQALGICITTQIAADICRDSGSSSLANIVELGGRLLILALTLPMLMSIAQLAVGLIRG
ncbi:MAG: stage III sporulation AC/AD family protein [Oscillospiraceae bacterium]|nr:stage III sporulation AC/AD family protein [Oscillospiraceae bacterium]